MPKAHSSPIVVRRQRLARRWRWILAGYAIALTIGTHWPHLQLGTEQYPVSDKLIHAGAFGVLALLLWQARIVRSLPLLWLAGVAWTVCDEISQGIPGLGRTVSPLDVLASSIGVTLAVALLWASGPVGRPRGASRLAHDRLRWSIEETLDSPRAIAMIGAALALGALVGGPVGWLVANVFINPRPTEGAMLGIGFGAAGAAQLALEVLRRRHLRRAAPVCFECGAPPPTFDEAGRAECPSCGGPLHAGQWRSSPSPRRVSALRLVTGAMALALITVAGIFGLWLGVLALRLRHPAFASLDASYNGLSYDMRLVLDLAWLGILAAVATRLVRRGLARLVDRQHERCVACGHDLRGTPLEGGSGRCGECGASFVGV
ncbi:MAG: hypothetical protein U0575_14665 [Phycisphaerales bacterium]